MEERKFEGAASWRELGIKGWRRRREEWRESEKREKKIDI